MQDDKKSSLPFIAVRGSGGLSLVEWTGEETDSCQNYIVSEKTCRVMKFSRSGERLAWCNGFKMQVMEVKSRKVFFSTNLSRTYDLCFSPDESILCTWEPHAVTNEFPQGKPNLQMWNVTSGECIYDMVQKKVDGWRPVWARKSNICAKLVGNTVRFFKDNNFSRFAAKLNIDKLESFELSPDEERLRVACFVRGAKGAPSFVRIFNYPRFSSTDMLANKSFFKADSVKILWNKKGSCLLVKAAVDVDTTGGSYYGEQSLHFMSCKGDTAIVTLSKKGPIYDAAWSPNSTQFCVVFGFMPAKACVFDLKCNQVFEFSSTPKNECYFNPQGNLLVLAGFGNLRGNIEVWDFERKKQVSQFQSLDTTYFEWCSDGARFVTATTSPRLRVGNGYKLWHFKNGVCYKHEADGEINEVSWQPTPAGTYPAPIVEDISTKEISKIIQASKPVSYIPPHARGKAEYSTAKNRFAQDDDEPVVTEEKPLSKSAQRNKRKKEQKKNKQAADLAGMSSEQQDAVNMAKYLLQDSSSTNSTVTSEKRIKGLKKKLQAIEKLKVQRKEGKQLDINQIEKVNSEASLVRELKRLELNS